MWKKDVAARRCIADEEGRVHKTETRPMRLRPKE
jgi:hypothetical protein